MNLEQAFEEYSSRSRRTRGRARPFAEIAGGSALALYGASRRDLSGAGLAAIGGFLVYRGIRGSQGLTEPIHVQQSFTIMRPVEEVYQFWRNFENLPRFMQHVRSVRVIDERRSRWEAYAPAGMSVSWEAEITDERENAYIVWRTLPGAAIPNRGSVEFRSARQGAGTMVIAAIDYTPPGGKMGAVFAKMFGEEPEIQVREDLRRMKQLLETGEIPTTEGQASGRRSPWMRMIEAATAERDKERTA